MRELIIATADRVNARKWYNHSVTYDYILEKLKTTIRTMESKAMKSADRLLAKDHGGFIGCSVLEKTRDVRHIKSRSILTLDADSAEPWIVEKLQESNVSLVVYSTHGHTAEEPRVRVIVPLTCDISSDEYNAVSRFFAAEFGITQFDPVSFIPHQLLL